MGVYVTYGEANYMKKNLLTFVLLSGFCQFQTTLFAQNGLVEGNRMENIAINRLLNAAKSNVNFSMLQKKITILDFFGTWCVPCLKALPLLSEIHGKYKDEVSIILVSNESAEQLDRFINKRPGFLFPIIVDEDNQWNKLFQPPALPYTIILKGNQVLAITEAEKITTESIEGWLKSDGVATVFSKDQTSKTVSLMGINYSSNLLVQLSQQFIYAAKTGEPAETFISGLSAITESELEEALPDDNAKKAFWINLYNGYTQYSLKKDPGSYKNRNAFFRNKNIFVAGHQQSLDDIEHGYLRRSKTKWSLGYVNKLFPGKREKRLRVEELDYRLHFALNCGAKSCPPIAFYSDEKIDAQLEQATRAYLASEVEYDKGKNIIYLPKLASWFRADFGGKKGMLRMLKKYAIIPLPASPKIKFKNYDWSLTLNNYINQQL